jgi:serine/threonine-protein kinase
MDAMAAPLRLLDSDAAAQAERRSLERAVAGRYRVVELISRGGMAAVYRGWEPGLERNVALKMLAPDRALDPDERGRFRREARILATLSHPNIVATLGIGETPDACWFAMPYLPGGTLAQRLGQGARLGHPLVRAILVQLADALAFAHARGVIHRDLKAENILLGEAGQPVVSDFGVAIVSTSDHSRAEITKGYGTPEYMPPEQYLGTLECDGRQDLYALGVLGFRMLTGRFPVQGSAEQIAAAHLMCPAPPVAAHIAGVPGDLAHAIDRCLARRPQDRWDSGTALRAALVERRSRRRSLWQVLRHRMRLAAR